MRKLVDLCIALVLSATMMAFEVWLDFQPKDKFENKKTLFFVLAWLSFILAAIVQFCLGRGFYKSCFNEIFRWREVGMYTFVCIASTFAFIYGTVVLIIAQVHFLPNIRSYFFGASSFTVASVMLGNTISYYLQKKANADLVNIASLRVSKVNLWNESAHDSRVEDLRNVILGDQLLVKHLEQVPTDGILLSSTAIVNESVISGESLPVNKKKGDSLIGTSVNLGDFFLMKVTKLGNDTVISQIINNVNLIKASKPRILKVADVVAKWFSLFVVTTAVLSFFINAFVLTTPLVNTDMGTNPYERAALDAVSVMVISCSCSLGIAAPLATVIGSSKAARHGISFVRTDSFEKTDRIDIVAFDKTGTLTLGQLGIEKIIGDSRNFVTINALELISSHPLARSLVDYFKAQKYHFEQQLELLNAVEKIGIGIFAKNSHSDDLAIVSLDYAQQQCFSFSDEISSWLKIHNGDSGIYTYACFVINQQVLNLLVFKDQIRNDAAYVVKLLQKHNIKVCIISGDNLCAVKNVAHVLGISEYYANTTPSEKIAIIKNLQLQSNKVAYVGDGVNDLGALEQADLSISIGTNATNLNCADINIINSDILNIYYALMISKQTKRMIKINIFWAFFYNALAIPLAFLGIVPAYLAAVLMVLSSIVICTNSLIYKYRKLKVERK